MWRYLTLIFPVLLAGPLAAQYMRGGGGFRPPNVTVSGRSGFGAPQVPPGTYLDGVPGPRITSGLNGLPAFSNRHYQYGCYPCGPEHGGRGHEFDGRGQSYFPYFGFVPLFGSYAFPTYVGDQPQAPPPEPPPVDPTATALTDEVGRLREDIQQLKSMAEAQAQPPAAAPAPADPSAPPAPPEPATIIVLRDGRRLETTNYAVMDQTLWNFSSRPVQKIPLSSVDVNASQKANAERGIDFSAFINSTN